MEPSSSDWPDWWSWELDCSNPHLAKRMIDRGFSETDLRQMLETAHEYEADDEPGRWEIRTAHFGRRWHVIVEPQVAEKLLVIVTAYPLE